MHSRAINVDEGQLIRSSRVSALRIRSEPLPQRGQGLLLAVSLRFVKVVCWLLQRQGMDYDIIIILGIVPRDGAT